MRERRWFIPEQVLKGKLPYRDSETFYGPQNPFLLAVVYYTGGIGLTPERATGFAYRLIFLGAMFCLARRWNSTVASGCTLFAALFSGESGCHGLCVDGAAGLRPVLNLSLNPGQAIDPVYVSPPISVGRIGSFSTGASHVWNEPNPSSEFGSDASNQMVRSRFKICGEDGAHLLCRRRKDGS